MRRWMLISAAAITSLVAVLFVVRSGDDVSPAAVADPVAVEARTTDHAGPATGPAPSLPADPAAVPQPTGNNDLDQMVRDLATSSDAELAEKLAAIDKEIADHKLVERANAGTLSAAEHAALGGLLRRSNAVNIVKTQRLVAKLDALDSETGAVAEPRTP